MNNSKSFKFKVHSANLIQEILNNKGTEVLHKPLLIFRNILGQVAERAAELNDVELNKLMMQLALYEIADPESKEYDVEFVSNYLDCKFDENKE